MFTVTQTTMVTTFSPKICFGYDTKSLEDEGRGCPYVDDDCEVCTLFRKENGDATPLKMDTKGHFKRCATCKDADPQKEK